MRWPSRRFGTDDFAHFPDPFSVTTVLPVLGAMTPIARAADGFTPLTAGMKVTDMAMVAPGDRSK